MSITYTNCAGDDVALIYTKTGEMVQRGDVVHGRDGEVYTVMGGRGSRSPGSTGRLWVRKDGSSMQQEFYPHVFDMSWGKL